MALSRDEILGAEDRPVDEVPVPEWGGDVRVMMLDGADSIEGMRAALG